MQVITIVIATALLSSALTLGGAYWLYRNRLRAKLRAALDAELVDLGDMVQTRVRAGVLDAVSSIPSRDVLAETTRNVTRSGVSILEDGLGSLFRPPKKR